MKAIARREALAALIGGGTGLLLAENAVAFARQPAAVPKAFAGQHQIKPLPFDPAKLKGISEKLIRSHWENNYSGALRALNVVEQRLAAMATDKDLPAYVYGDLKREEALRTGSVVLHEIYFSLLGGEGKAGGDVLNALKQAFGSHEAWEAEFKRTGAALGGGSGWVMLGLNLHTGELHNYWSWDHLHNAPTSVPLLVMDMYEHAYQMDYGAAAAKYIDAFLTNLSWEEINRRYVKAQKAWDALKAT
ncbi:MAG: superoxide dismutase [Acidobacteria bacterium]|nr:superoxide dismutase [Acidobacteriota bacterium]MBI3423875.1 superoxide dismutase [Acidobacteriota bacterium]